MSGIEPDFSHKGTSPHNQLSYTGDSNGFLGHTVDYCFTVVIAMGTEKIVRIEEVTNLLLDPKMKTSRIDIPPRPVKLDNFVLCWSRG
jgi:hypothetical protein